MKSALLLLASIAGLVLVASCSDDPLPTGRGYVAPTYRASVQSMNGDFDSVCGAGNGDLYAFGPAFLHYDGSHWGTIEPPTSRYSGFRFAMGFPAGELVVNNGGETFLRQGGAWTDISDKEGRYYYYYDAMWASAPNDLYAISSTRLRHFDGVAWSTVTLPDSTLGLASISGRSANDIVIAAYAGRMIRYDGARWTQATIDTLASYNNVAMTASGRTFVSTFNTIHEVTGSAHHVILQGTIDDPMLCTDHDVLYAAGRSSHDPRYFVIARYENDSWQNVAQDLGDLNNVWVGGGTVLAGGSDALLWRGTSSAGSTETVFPKRGRLACAANIDGAIFVAGESAYRYESGLWTNLDKESATHNMAQGIAGRSRNSIYAVGDEMVLHYDGSAWNWLNGGFGNNLYSAWVDDTGDLWVAGSSNSIYGVGAVYHLHGSTWSPVEMPWGDSERVYAMWGTGETLFVVGSNGVSAVRKSGVWRQLPTITNAPLVSLWGYDEQHVYAANGNADEVCFFDGRTWQPMPVYHATWDYLRSIWGTSPSDLFVMDGNGAVLHYDGRTWQPLERALDGVSTICGSGRDLLAVGYAGSVLYQR